MISFLLAYLWGIIIVPTCCIIVKPVRFLVPKFDLDFCFSHFIYSVLNIKHTIIWNAPLIETGFILPNHRCALDWGLDCYITKSTGIGRGLAYIATSMLALLIYLDGRGIVIHRGKDGRAEIYRRMLSHIQTQNKRICFWPEGTRLSYTTLSTKDDVRSYLKYGLLKEIYLDKQFPVQLCISSNKELALNEKRLVAKRGVPITTIISKPIHPRNFATENEFYDEIAAVWLDCWEQAYLPLS
jgi:hypothetical protein